MSGQFRSTPYASVPTSEAAVPLTTYPPSSTHQQQQSGGYTYSPPPPDPVSQPTSAPAYGSSFSVPASSSASQTTFNNLNYSDSPKPAAQELFPSLDQHDFTPGPYKSDPNRWSYSSSSFPPPNVKKFSRAWWHYKWRIQVSRRRLPRLLYSLTGLVLLCVWVGVSAGFATNIEASEASNSLLGNTQETNGAAGSNFVLFFLQGQLNSFDLQARKLNIDWSALMIQGPIRGDDLSSANQVSVEAYGNNAIAMYRDTVARQDTGLNASALGYIPFRLRDPYIPPVGFLGVSDFDSINTDIGLGQKAQNIWTQPEFGYPWDVFKGTITFVAADNGTITSSGRPGSGVVRMEGAILTDNLLNLKIKASTNATCLEPMSVAEGCELIITLWVERTGLVKFCVVAVFIINWAVTIAIFLVTGEALLLNRKDILDGTDILAVCFTALFALPTVRSLLPGVPDYGCLIDLFGILPCIIVLTLCTTFFANSRLRMHARRSAEVAAEAAKAN